MIYLLSFVIMALIMAGMALGAMAGRGPLKGSCGGLAAVGIEGRCEICGDDPSLCEEQNGNTSRASALQGSEETAQYYDASRPR